MIKLFVTDLDHTLLNDAKQVEVENVNAIQKLINSGIQLAVASGRSHREIKHVINHLGHSYHVISQNGVYVHTHEQEELHSTVIPYMAAQHIMEVLSNSPVHTFINIGDQAYTTKLSDLVKEYIDKTGLPSILEEPNVASLLSEERQPCKIAFAGAQDQLLKLKNQIENGPYQHVVDLYLSSPDVVDVVPKGVSKGTGLQHLIQKLGLNINEVACIGDSYNDVPMLQMTPQSFAMSVADQEVQKAAHYVVTSVSEAIEQVLQENKAISLNI